MLEQLDAQVILEDQEIQETQETQEIQVVAVAVAEAEVDTQHRTV